MNMKSFLAAAIVGLTTLTVTPSANADAPGIIPGLSDYMGRDVRAKSPVMFTYMPDGQSYLVMTDGGKKIVKYDTATGKEIETVIDVSHTRESTIERISGFSLSPDASKMLIYTDAEGIYRWSFRAKYYVFEVKRNILRELSTNHEKQESPVFSPDSRMVAFVAENNIYLKKLDYNTEVAVTTDGKVNSIINGVPDWTYQEEFETTTSMAWSPDNTTLCYLKYNETEVPMFTFSLYEGVCPAREEYALYPGEFSYKYPLPGINNAIVTLHSYDIETRKTKDITFSDSQIEYIPRIAFGGVGSDRLIVTTLNRDQNRLEMYTVNPKSTVVKSIVVDKAKAWIIPEAYENITYNDNDFVIYSTRSGYTHLYQYSYTGQLLRQITNGNFDVTAYYGGDALGNHYYQSTCNGAINKVVSMVDKKGVVKHLSPLEGVASATFSPAHNFYVLRHSTAKIAPVYTLFNSKNKEVRVLEDNKALTARMASLPTKEFITVPSDGEQLNAYMLKPKNFDASKQYPLIMWQYSGPGSQQVLNQFGIDWMQEALNQGYIVACVDPRGTGGRGEAFMTSVYCHLGVNETIDQANAARYFAQLPYIDGNRIGIAGWSYGGYETLMSVSGKNSPFAAGVAIAPVTSWRYYDSIYTERYMLTPAQNADGYQYSSPVNLTDDMNSRLLIMSGTADDNVHFSNTVEYLARLQGSGKLCNLMIFPNKDHGIYGCNATQLVWSNLLHHFNSTLK